jgi:hypothetical protein
LPPEQPIFYLDDRCTLPVIEATPDPPNPCLGPEPFYVGYPAFVSCPEPRRMVAVRRKAIDAPQKLFQNGGYDACLPVGSVAPARYYELVPSPAADWMALDRQVVSEAPGIGIEMWQGDDGSRIRGTPRYLPDDVECTAFRGDGQATLPGAPFDEPAYCVPANIPHAGAASADPTCSPASALVAMGKCESQPFTYDDHEVSTDAGFYSGRSFFRVGAPVTSGVYGSLFGGCVPLDGTVTDLAFRREGSPVAVTDFPGLDFARQPAGALERLGWTASGGGFVVAADRLGWPDAGAGSARTCVPSSFAEGTELCVPEHVGFDAWGGAAFTVGYTDPSCSPGSEIDVFSLDVSRGDAPPDIGRWMVTDTKDACWSDGVTARQLTALHEGTAYGSIWGSCVALTPASVWFVADLGPARQARNVLPRLVAQAL